VALVPDPLKEGRFDLYRLSTIGPNGQFTIQGIAPGNYKLYAWEEMEAGAYQDSDFLKKYDGKGQPVSIKLKGKEEVTLKLIPSENLGQ
jgi:Polysaccharide lyase family 4, domain II